MLVLAHLKKMLLQRNTTQYILPQPAPARKLRWLVPFLLLGILIYGSKLLYGPWVEKQPPMPSPENLRLRIAQALEHPISRSEFPNELDITVGEQATKTGVVYTLDWTAQNYMEKLFRTYRPDYGAFVAMDANTGRVLSLVSYSRNATDLGHLALRASYPAASVIKIITAAAAIDRKKVTPNTPISFNGGNHTLYKRNITQVTNRWSRHVTLSEAFAKSINAVFAKVGLYMLDPPDLMEYAQRFQFNQSIPADVPVQPSHFQVSSEDPWGIAEAASGFTRLSTLSPLQGALIAAAVANDGVMMAPFMVERLYSNEAGMVYSAEPNSVSVTVSPESAKALRSLMRETVRIGTSRSIFRHLLRKRGFMDVEMGGKTGSLVGMEPKGKYDWFVGYARYQDRKIAVSALTINEEKWQVKASYLARSFIEQYFSNK